MRKNALASPFLPSWQIASLLACCSSVWKSGPGHTNYCFVLILVTYLYRIGLDSFWSFFKLNGVSEQTKRISIKYSVDCQVKKTLKACQHLQAILLVILTVVGIKNDTFGGTSSGLMMLNQRLL